MVRRIIDFKDGEYILEIRKIKDNGLIHAMCYTKGWRKYCVDLSLGFLERFYTGTIREGRSFDMTISDNGNQFYFERHYFSRRGKFRKERAKFMIKILAEDYGSVDAFLRHHEGKVPPLGSPQREILKTREKDYFNGIERKLG